MALTAGQVHDSVEAEALIEPVAGGGILLADKGYDAAASRAKAAEKRMFANIPPRRNRKGRFVFSIWLYRAAHRAAHSASPRNSFPLA
ncbi:transposase [Rhodomicrobium udaipurense JA643]|nr:transposase [Rhodomicrobium udaipurense JA643]